MSNKTKISIKKIIKGISIPLFLIIPLITQAQYTNKELIPGQSPTNDLETYLNNIYNFGIAIAAILAVFMIALGAFIYIFTSAGNASKMMDAKDMIKNALIGLSLVLVAFLILFIINPDLVGGTISGPSNVIKKVVKVPNASELPPVEIRSTPNPNPNPNPIPDPNPSCQDSDSDGYDACSPGDPDDSDGKTKDCNDSDSSMNPGESEACDDNKDNDCDGQINEGCIPDQPEGHDDYRSIYEYGYTVGYRDSLGNPHTEKRYSFKDLFDLSDPTVMCGDESGCSDLPPGEFTLETTDLDFSYSKFRMYIPPGTNYLDIKFFAVNVDIIAVAGRFGSPIGDTIDLVLNDGSQVTTNYDDLTKADYNENIDWDSVPQDTLFRDWADRVSVKRNSGGVIQIVSGGLGGALTEGGWFYFKVIPFKTGARLIGIDSYSRVDTDIYIPWFNNTQWDRNDDPF